MTEHTSSPASATSSGSSPASPLGHVSDAPTRPAPSGTSSTQGDYDLDVADLFGTATPTEGSQDADLAEKLRQAYFWVVNHAIISPHYDVEFSAGPGTPETSFRLGDSKALLTLPSDQSYSSFVLLPLLTFAVRGRCLLIGGPGRGKTASAVLMGVLAGYPIQDVRRAMQHGHPQLTVSDMFGTPLPKDLVQADSLADVDVAWRSWLGMRVKIVDEYNRIPTRTQSALLTVLADGYVEVFDQFYETGESAWYLTANDDAGGGTYQVVEALRDRIDVVVHALPFNNRFLGDLVARAEQGIHPERAVPESIVFDDAQHERLHREVTAVQIERPVRRRLEFFASQLELLEGSAWQFEYRTKDTARLAGIDPHLVASSDTGRDKLSDIGAQTLNGLSVRALQSLVAYAKAMAYFRGRSSVGLDDLRAVLPFVLHDKLVPDQQSTVFDDADREPLRSDRVSWIRTMFDDACAQYDAYGLDQDDPVGEVLEQVQAGLDSLGEDVVLDRMRRIEQILAGWEGAGKLHGHVYEDALVLKYAHQRYTNYLTWLRWYR
ncbi:AAA family ATPase [Sanguibacter inulinus]|uniref:AAA family ATPase n=1 Tax=Sanguibacter inulinus TaxID=60922 RepID=A0A853EZ82_9MICO|nr:MoxR family ATPase [Sanguibacter inulinus]MBF0722983.1 AAA family ATPase [Sanguibacter inulinus]NYS94128.1 AAA family ATPase [Sanguibacter inulinus]